MATARITYGTAPPPVGTARTFEEIVEPVNYGTGYTPGQHVQFDVPTGRRNAYLDPRKTWLELTLKNNCKRANGTSVAAQLDGSGHSLLRSLRLFDKPGGSVLEEIGEYAALAHIVINATATAEELGCVRAVGEGFFPRRFTSSLAAGAGVTTTGQGAAPYQGQVFESSATAQTFTTASTYPAAYANGNVQTLGLPLMSAVGLLGDKYVPVHALTRPVRLELQLNDANAVFIQTNASVGNNVTVLDGNSEAYSDTPTLQPYPTARDTVDTVDYLVTNVRLHLGYVQLDDATQEIVASSTSGNYTWTAQSFRLFRQPAFNFEAKVQTFFIPARFSSARSVACVWRDSAQLSTLYLRYSSSFSRMFTSSVQFRLGDKPLPQRPMTSIVAMARSFLDGFGRYIKAPSDVAERGTCLGPINFTQECFVKSTGTSADNPGSFCMAVDLGGPCGNEMDVFMGGAQTLGQDLVLTTTNSLEPVSSVLGFSANLDAFVLHDVLFTIDAQGNFTATV